MNRLNKKFKLINKTKEEFGADIPLLHFENKVENNNKLLDECISLLSPNIKVISLLKLIRKIKRRNKRINKIIDNLKIVKEVITKYDEIFSRFRICKLNYKFYINYEQDNTSLIGKHYKTMKDLFTIQVKIERIPRTKLFKDICLDYIMDINELLKDFYEYDVYINESKNRIEYTKK